MRKYRRNHIFMNASCFLIVVLAALLLISNAVPVQAQTVTASLPTGANPRAIAVNVSANKIYTANFGSNTVSVIDGAADSVTTIPVGMNPVAIAVNGALNRAYVANYGSNNATV